MNIRGRNLTNTERYLAWLIAEGRLTSTYEQYISQSIRRSRRNGGSFYTKILAAQGREAAEAALAAWNAKHRRSDYASLIESVARGMLALAKAERSRQSKRITLFDVTGDMAFPHDYRFSSGKVVVLVNHETPSLGGPRIHDQEIFGFGGQMGIKAIVISHDEYAPEATMLGIVLPMRGMYRVDPEVRESGFTVLSISCDGMTGGSTVYPDQPKPEWLAKTLTLHTNQIPGINFADGGELAEALGHPGAVNYFADNLARLEQYLTALADRL